MNSFFAKKIHITESQFNNMINESISSKIYHFTSISNALKISEEDAIFLQSSLEGYSNTSNSSKLFYLSTTRTKYQSFGYSRKFSDNSARIEFDGDKLNNDFSAKPYNYWGDDMGKPTYLKNDNKGLTIDKQEHVRDEAEDRLLSHKGVIEPAHKYIKRIDIILKDTSENNRTNYLNARNLLTSRYSRIVFVYNNLNDFNKQNDNTINNQILDDFESYGFGSYDNGEYKLNNDAIKIVLAAIFNGESDNPMKDSANLLKQYGLERYLKSGVLKSNEYMKYPYYFDFNRLSDELSTKLSELSRRPSREKQKILQMLSDYFRKNNLKNYKDYIKYKSFAVELADDYMLIRRYIDKGYIDPNKKINVLLIRNNDTYDDVIVTDVNKVKVSDFNKDLNSVGEFFVNDTWENSKSNSYDSYRKYIINIFKKDPTIGYVIGLLKKLGYNDNMIEMLQSILNAMVEEKTIGVYDLKYDMVMPQCIYNKKYNVSKFLELFKK